MLIDRLIECIIKTEAPIVVGLDPRLEKLPQSIIDAGLAKYKNRQEAAAYSMYLFNTEIIDAIVDIVPAVKPQVAFYECLGLHGMKAYKLTCDYAAQKGLIVIADVKRGDIGSTSKAYADAYLGISSQESVKSTFYSDFLTVNPYLGTDCLDAFVDNIDAHDKGMFVLVKTSNKSSGQLQDLVVDDATIYEKVADIVESYSCSRLGQYGYSSIGAVVGATYPEQAANLRRRLKTSYFLVPGYGAQGGGGADIVTSFDDSGLGAIINSSRGIIYAYQNPAFDDDFKVAAQQAVLAMKQDINDHLKAAGKWYKKSDVLQNEVKSQAEQIGKNNDESIF